MDFVKISILLKCDFLFFSFLSRKWKDNPQSRKKNIYKSYLLSVLYPGNSTVVQWLGLSAFTAEDLASIPGQGTKIPHATRQG